MAGTQNSPLNRAFSIALEWLEVAFTPALPTPNWQILSRLWQTLYLLGVQTRVFLPIEKAEPGRLAACLRDRHPIPSLSI